jgi:hypothetical protein
VVIDSFAHLVEETVMAPQPPPRRWAIAWADVVVMIVAGTAYGWSNVSVC